MADGRTRRMHTVLESYFESFAVQDPARRTSCVWRFDRISGKAKLVGVGDSEVAKDIYTVFSNDGNPDTGIKERILCEIKGAFCSARNAIALVPRSPPIQRTLDRDRPIPLMTELWSDPRPYTFGGCSQPARKSRVK